MSTIGIDAIAVQDRAAAGGGPAARVLEEEPAVVGRVEQHPLPHAGRALARARACRGRPGGHAAAGIPRSGCGRTSVVDRSSIDALAADLRPSPRAAPVIS